MKRGQQPLRAAIDPNRGGEVAVLFASWRVQMTRYITGDVSAYVCRC